MEAVHHLRRRQLRSVSFTSTDRGFTSKFTDYSLAFYKAIREAYDSRPVDKPELPIKEDRTVRLLVESLCLLVIHNTSRSISQTLAESSVKQADRCPASHARMQVTLLGASVLKIRTAARTSSSLRMATRRMRMRFRAERRRPGRWMRLELTSKSHRFTSEYFISVVISSKVLY